MKKFYNSLDEIMKLYLEITLALIFLVPPFIFAGITSGFSLLAIPVYILVYWVTRYFRS